MNSITSAEAWHSSSIYWRRKRSYKVIYRYAECDEARVRTDLFAGGPHVSVDLMFALWFVVSLVSTKRGVKDVTERSHVVFKDTLQLPCLDYPPGLSACPRLCSAYFARLCRVKYSGNGRRVSLPFSSIIDFRSGSAKHFSLFDLGLKNIQLKFSFDKYLIKIISIICYIALVHVNHKNSERKRRLKTK